MTECVVFHVCHEGCDNTLSRLQPCIPLASTMQDSPNTPFLVDLLTHALSLCTHTMTVWASMVHSFVSFMLSTSVHLQNEEVIRAI
jgi:hypothetical protein